MEMERNYSFLKGCMEGKPWLFSWTEGVIPQFEIATSQWMRQVSIRERKTTLLFSGASLAMLKQQNKAKVKRFHSLVKLFKYFLGLSHMLCEQTFPHWNFQIMITGRTRWTEFEHYVHVFQNSFPEKCTTYTPPPPLQMCTLPCLSISLIIIITSFSNSKDEKKICNKPNKECHTF